MERLEWKLRIKKLEEVKGLSIKKDEKEALLFICELISKDLDRLYSLSEKDLLGDWLNRRGLFQRAERIFTEYNRNICQSVCVAFIDLDKFKDINDKYGHKYGDEVVVTVAAVISSSIRKSDIYGRLSGDEFVVILPGTSLKTATMILSRIKEKLCSTEFSFNIEKLPISLSFGVVSTKNGHEQTFEELLHKADLVMNSCKGDRSRRQ